VNDHQPDPDPGIEIVEAPRPTAARSPVDVLRAAVAGVILLLALILGRFFGSSIVGLASDLMAGGRSVSEGVLTVFLLSARVGATLLFIGAFLAAVVRRRFRLLALVVLAAVVAAVLMNLVDGWLTESAPPVADIRDVGGLITDEEYPDVAGLAAITAGITVAAPWIGRLWRRVGWLLVFVLAVSRFLTAPLSFDTPAALAAGWLIGALVLVVFGGPVHRARGVDVAAALAGVGLPIRRLEQAKVDARGSTPWFAVGTDGRRLFVKVLGRDERSADLLFRVFRFLVPRDLGDLRPFSSLRRAVEHEALVALAARDLGVRTPEFLALAETPPSSFVLVYEAIEGRSLDRVDADELDDEVLRAIWEQVAVLRTRRIAHRDLRLANIFLDAGGTPWLIDFGFSELAASELLLATDLAELLSSMSLQVGPERAVAAGAAVVGAEVLRTAAPRMRGYALSGATRTAMKERHGLLDELRGDVGGRGPASAAA
jgi:glycosyltransferase 2 family protein